MENKLIKLATRAKEGDIEAFSALITSLEQDLYRIASIKLNVLVSQLIKQEESYVENEKGERFYPSQSAETDGGYSFNTDGKLHKWETFNLTKFEATENLKVVLTTIDNEQIIVELQK